MKFSGKNVLVTGGSRGIGKAISKVLAGYGLKVWINYRSNPDLAEELKSEIEKDGGEVALVKFDISNEEEFIKAISLIIDSDGELSYLVNNAGITKDKLAMRMSTQDFRDVVDINLTATFVGCREALKVMMKKKFGAVVNISSIIGEMGNMAQVNYSASKGGVNAMTKSFAKESGSRNIRFNAITPGFIATEMTDVLKDEIVDMYKKNIPLGRFGEPEEVAESVAFLLSNNSSYITGEILRLNGGMYM
jgi:3-oxoacyl-[acyl-carrier protein] reductase